MEEVARRQHLPSYTGAPYRCDVCYRGFIRQHHYDLHILRHSEQRGAYECFICRSRFKSAHLLRGHLTEMHTLQFNCKKCKFVTRNRGAAKYHENYHAGVKYTCPHCPSEFEKITTYFSHVRIKHGSDSVCEFCGFTFIGQRGVELHKQRKHLADVERVLEGPYCEICDVRFISEEAHDRHLRLSSKHSSDDDPKRPRNDSRNVNAKVNKGAEKRRRRPVQHTRVTLEPRLPGHSVVCEQCGLQLRSFHVYLHHFRNAHPGKSRTNGSKIMTPYMCEQCGKLFKSNVALEEHMWVHTGEKRFKCDKCPKSFTQKSNLSIHLWSHTSKPKTYECSICGKLFSQYSNCRRHILLHTGLRPHKCEACGKSFSTAGERHAHIKHVHMKEPWPKRVRRQRPSARGNARRKVEVVSEFVDGYSS